MRELQMGEVAAVSGAGGETYDPCTCTCPEPEKKAKNNNGYGNGAESGPPPGNSGEHNPQLIEDNRGPRGPR